MQTKSQIARIASALAIAVILPLAILMTMVHGGKKPLAEPGMKHHRCRCKCSFQSFARRSPENRRELRPASDELRAQPGPNSS